MPCTSGALDCADGRSIAA